MEPLHDFIVSRELEVLLPDIVACLRPYEEKSELHFSEAMVASLWFRWDGKKCFAHIGLWESGDCDLDALDSDSGAPFGQRHKRCTSKDEFIVFFTEAIRCIYDHETIA